MSGLTKNQYLHCIAGSLTAYKRSIECYKKEKAARQQAKEKALKRARAKQSSLPNGNASHSGAADAGGSLLSQPKVSAAHMGKSKLQFRYMDIASKEDKQGLYSLLFIHGGP